MSALSASPVLPPVLLDGENPFADGFAGEPWAIPEDVPEIHARAGEALLEQVERTRGDGEARVCLLVGESGTGKSHLLGRLRRRLGPSAFFVFIDPYVSTERLFRHAGYRLADSLWRKDGAGRPLERWLDSVLLKSFDACDPGWLDALRARFAADLRSGNLYRDPERAPHIRCFIEQALGEPARLAGGDALAALAATRDPARSALALTWLRGYPIDPPERDLLGLKREEADEDQARRTIAALAALAEGAGPLVLCFDQTESLPRAAGGAPGLGDLVAALGRFRQEARNVVAVVTCLGELLTRFVPPAGICAPVELSGLDRAAAHALVASRLAARLGRAPVPRWSFPESFYERLGERPSARDVLGAAAREFERLRRAAGRPPEEPKAADPSPHWRAALRAAEGLARAEPPPPDDVVADGLRTVAEWRAAAGLSAFAAAPEGIDAAFGTAAGTAMIALSARDGRRFRGQMAALTRLASAPDRPRVLLLRRDAFPERWTTALALLEEFGQAGGLVCGLDAATECRLVAVRRLRLAAAAGDVGAPGGSVATPAEVGLGVARAGLLCEIPIVRMLEAGHGR